MEAIGQLTGGVAHDFNNVLQIIAGNLQLLKMGGTFAGKALTRLEQAQAGVERGARLASHLLAFARRQPLQAVVVDPAVLLGDAEDMLRRVLGERIAVVFDIAADLWNVAVDPNQLTNVLLNLAINARDAMPAGGTLTVRAANADGPVPGLASASACAGGCILIEVIDDGHGMPASVLERAFDPFFTTKPTGEGTGLGLSMAYGFIKQSGGEIQLDSAPGHGTTVRIYLGRSDEQARDIGLPPLVAVPSNGGTETILVVEDETDVRTTTVDLLLALGYRVLQAEDARGAIEIVQSGAAIDLVFTDVIMPGQVTSCDLSETVRETLPARRCCSPRAMPKACWRTRAGSTRR
jgi:CheY-like chemotaxis protein